MVNNKHRASRLLFSVGYWVLVAFYFVTVRYSGLGDSAPPGLHYGEVVTYGVVVGFFIGVLFGLFPLNHLLLSKKRKSFLNLVLIGACCYVLFFTAVIFFTSLYGNSFRFAVAYFFSGNGLTVLFHLSMASLLYHFLLQINKKFGPGVLVKYTFGRYFIPKVEERAFLFLDLKSSTFLAERLDHVSYSRMVQDCYAELTVPLVRYNANVYQYVGDEVVVTWTMDRFFSAESCTDFFFTFCECMEARKDYFLLQYGTQPRFKAGIHCGQVTVAEVGELKTEIAYHGDVLNTASRIQNLCNQFQKDLLFSEAILRHLPEKVRAQAAFVVDATLRGKAAATKIYTINNSGSGI